MNKNDAALLRAFLAHGTGPFNILELDRDTDGTISYDAMLAELVSWVYPETDPSLDVIITSKGLERIRNLQNEQD